MMRSVQARLSDALHCVRRHLCGRVAERVAQMAESVDALVSNTSGATRAGSTPALGTGEWLGVLLYTLSHYLFFEGLIIINTVTNKV